MEYKIRSTTILGVRRKGQVALGGDGQVTFGDMAFKQKAVKVRKFKTEKGIILGGFAGAAADALSLFEKFELKLDEYEGELKRAVVELAKEWRMDKVLRNLEALLALIDNTNSYFAGFNNDCYDYDYHYLMIGAMFYVSRTSYQWHELFESHPKTSSRRMPFQYIW